MQLALQTMKPFESGLALCCAHTRSICAGLASGTINGTSGSMRWFRALLNTAAPCFLKASSTAKRVGGGPHTFNQERTLSLVQWNRCPPPSLFFDIMMGFTMVRRHVGIVGDVD